MCDPKSTGRVKGGSLRYREALERDLLYQGGHINF